MDFSTYVPIIAIGGLVVLAILIAIAYFASTRKKKTPLTPAAIPPVPGPKEASAHFPPNPQVATLHPHQGSMKHGPSKKLIGGALAGLTVITVLGVSFFVSNQQPKSLQEKAAPVTNINNNVHLQTTVGEVRGDQLVAGGTFGYYSTQPVFPTPTPVDIKVKVTLYYCPDVGDPSIETCTRQVGVDNQHAVLKWNDKQIEIIGGIFMNQRCGLYKVASTFLPYNSSETQGDKAGTAFYNWGRSCETPTGAPASSSASLNPETATTSEASLITTPILTPVPTATDIPTPTPASSAPLVNPTATPSPTVTPTVSPTNSGIATPTPTEIILANNVTSPTSATTPDLSPTIPESGNPVPFVAIGLPLLLIFLAFVL